jgi:hypothetical protein
MPFNPGVVVYVADTGDNEIRAVTSAGLVETLVTGGTGGWLVTKSPLTGLTVYSTAPTGHFVSPTGIAVDGSGVIYVSDAFNNTISRFGGASSAANVLAGLAANSGTANGLGNIARFNRPFGLAVDTAGNIYVGDSGNNEVRSGVAVAPLAITAQPPATVALSVGQTLTLSVMASFAGPLAYQWYDNGGNIAGATSSTYTKTNVQVSDSGTYGVQVSSAGAAVSSTPANVVVSSLPPPPSSGGGGAPSYWFYAALAALAIAWRMFGKRRAPSAN